MFVDEKAQELEGLKKFVQKYEKEEMVDESLEYYRKRAAEIKKKHPEAKEDADPAEATKAFFERAGIPVTDMKDVKRGPIVS